MQSPAQLLPSAEMGTAPHRNATMLFYVTTSAVYCDDFEPEYTTKFFRTREALEAYVTTLEDDEVEFMGELTEQQQEYYSQLIPF